MNIKEAYKPYNFSETSCFIISLSITGAGIKKIESKLPSDMKLIKGVYVTAKVKTIENTIGTLSLGFNESILKSLVLPIHKTDSMKFHSQPLRLCEEIKTNSTLTGFFLSALASKDYPMQIKIYLHYKREI